MNRRAFLLTTLVAPIAAITLAPTRQMVDFGLLDLDKYDWRAQHVEYMKGIQIERKMWDKFADSVHETRQADSAMFLNDFA